ncbi:Uncharacterised protein [Mycobacterium tuberculosis]|nr:Uncharacterised protein [Mycobacterium tuberculosis]
MCSQQDFLSIQFARERGFQFGEGGCIDGVFGLGERQRRAGQQP